MGEVVFYIVRLGFNKFDLLTDDSRFQYCEKYDLSSDMLMLAIELADTYTKDSKYGKFQATFKYKIR